MSTPTNRNQSNFTDEAIMNFVRGHEEPCVTNADVAEEFGVTKEAANYRLKNLRDDGRVAEKKVGASAKVWYLIG